MLGCALLRWVERSCARMGSSVRVTFCPACSARAPRSAGTPEGSVSVKIRADASVAEILRRLGKKFPQFATGQRLALLLEEHPPPPQGEQSVGRSEMAQRLQELTTAQQLRGGERLLVLTDRLPVCEQGRPADSVEARVWDMALPLQLLSALTVELTRNHRAATASSLPGEKMHTWWVPLDSNGTATHPCPSSTVPVAIRHLHELAFGDASGWKGEPPIGAEWWVQRRPLDCEISFHYDKDEALSSATDDLRMVCPLRSTVTYLDSLGSPTVVLNTSSVDGADMQPPGMPRQALISYPKRNKHLLFRGDLLHGVPASLRGGSGGTESSTARTPAAGKEIVATQVREGAEEEPMRMTFLVNWWHVRPGEPNCRAFSRDANFPLGPGSDPEPEPEPEPELEPDGELDLDRPRPREMHPLCFDMSTFGKSGCEPLDGAAPVSESSLPVLSPSAQKPREQERAAALLAQTTTEHAIELGSTLWSFTVPKPPPPVRSWADANAPSEGSTLRLTFPAAS